MPSGRAHPRGLGARAGHAEVDQPRRRAHDHVGRLDVEVERRPRRPGSAAPRRRAGRAAAAARAPARRAPRSARPASGPRGAPARGGESAPRGPRRTRAPAPGAPAGRAAPPRARGRPGAAGSRAWSGRSTLATSTASRCSSHTSSASQRRPPPIRRSTVRPGASASPSCSPHVGRGRAAAARSVTVVGRERRLRAQRRDRMGLRRDVPAERQPERQHERGGGRGQRARERALVGRGAVVGQREEGVGERDGRRRGASASRRICPARAYRNPESRPRNA